MKLLAPVGIVAGVRDEGLLFSSGWPRCSASAESELVVTLEGEPIEGVEVLPIPGASHLLAEAIEGWWGAHRWSHPGRSIAVRVGSDALDVDAWPIARLAAVLEHWCAELRQASWSWTPFGQPRGLMWVAGAIEIHLVVEQAVRVLYPTSRTDSGWTRISRAREEFVLSLDDRQVDDEFLVWLGYPSDSGWTANERLACPTPVGSLPRCLHVPRSRLRM